MMKRKTVLTRLSCEVCLFEMTIPRRVNKQKKPGHIKHMYCPMCFKEQAFIEGNTEDSSIQFWVNWQEEQNQLN